MKFFNRVLILCIILFIVVLFDFRILPLAVIIITGFFCFSWIHENQDKYFVKTEISRNVERIDLALEQLKVANNTEYAYANLSWSQSDLMAIIAKHLLSESVKESLGVLYAVALSLPLQHAKRTVFTEKPRMLAGEMTDETASKLKYAIKAIISSNERKVSRGLFIIIAYNQVIYDLPPLGNEIKREEFACYHPLLRPNADLRGTISDVLGCYN